MVTEYYLLSNQNGELENNTSCLSISVSILKEDNILNIPESCFITNRLRKAIVSPTGNGFQENGDCLFTNGGDVASNGEEATTTGELLQPKVKKLPPQENMPQP